MAIFRCKICGGTLEINDNSTVCLCEYCGTNQTLPRLDSEKKINLYDRADHFRHNNDYDKAMSIYESILNEDATDSEAYWSILLCRYGVEYVEDHTTHKHIPTINRAQFTSVLADEDYKSAITYADGNQKEIYEEEAKYIDDVQKNILEISQKEEPYDVFICYKETDSTGRRTKDSVLATDLYHGLTSEGYKVFFSRITLEDKLGTAYEPYIFAALNSAKVMVVIGTKAEYLNSVWVKNEWNRYLALIKSGAKKTLIPAYRDMDPYDLPEEFSHLQAQDMSKLGFMQDLIRGIKKLLSADDKKNINKATVITSADNVNIASLLKRVFMFLEDGEWEKADEYCEQVLNQTPECAEAYLGKLMAELHAHTKEQLDNCAKPFDDNFNYKKIIRFGNNALISEINKYVSLTNERIALQAEEERKKDLYVKAMDLSSFDNIDKLQHAIQLLSSLGEWKDSADRIRKCNERIEQINITNEQKRIKAEQDRIEKERETELRRIENDKRTKEYKKAAKIGLPILATFIAFVIILTTVIIPTSNYKRNIELYNKAIELNNKGKHFEALGYFVKVNGFEDSEKFLINYNRKVISLGTYSDIAIKVDGTVKSCGNNKYGQNNTSQWKNVVSVSVGTLHTVALVSDGTVIAVGDNSCNQCNVKSWRNIVAVSAGTTHTVALKADGTVIAVGDNDYGCCNVSDWKNIVSISAGTSYTVGLKSDGTVVSVGKNSENSNMNKWENIISVSTDWYATIGLKSDGSVIAIGDNSSGKCNVDNWNNIIDIEIGVFHSVGIRADNSVVAVGDNTYGQCDVDEWTDIVCLAVSNNYTVGLKNNGTVVVAGDTWNAGHDFSDWKNIQIPNK